MVTIRDRLALFPFVTPQIVGVCEAMCYAPATMLSIVKNAFLKLQEAYYRKDECVKFDVQTNLTANRKILDERIGNFVKAILTIIPLYGIYRYYYIAKRDDEIKAILESERKQQVADEGAKSIVVPPKERIAQLEKAMGYGSAEAEYYLSKLSHLEARSQKEGDEKALKHLKKAAEAGYAVAQFQFAEHFTQEINRKEKVKDKDLKEAIEKDKKMEAFWHRKAALQGHEGSIQELGIAYDLARGVDRSYVLSNHLYKKVMNTQINSKVYYCENLLKGQGIKANPEEALKMLEAVVNNPLRDNLKTYIEGMLDNAFDIYNLGKDGNDKNDKIAKLIQEKRIQWLADGKILEEKPEAKSAA